MQIIKLLKYNLINSLKLNKLLNELSLTNILANKESISFVLINILVALFSFIRSFLFMKTLDLKELGMLTLVQTGAMLICFFQIGLINGGYRIFALQNNKLSEDTNNIIFSYFGLLTVLLTIVYLIISITGLISDKFIIGISILIGLFLLLSNWLSNTLIAGQEHKRYNKSNLTSVFVSIAFLPLAYYWGLYGGAICILIQPFTFILIVFLTGKSILPTNFIFKISLIKNILHYGFIPYLSGLFFLLYMQIERWSIATFLGATALGSYYLVFMITTLWVLIPTSINSLFFPRAVKYYENKELESFRNIIRIYFWIVIVYSLIAGIFIFTLLTPMVSIVFPKHLPFVKYAFLIIPGLIFKTLIDPISLFMNSIVKLKPLLWSDISGLVIYFMLICIIVVLKLFTLNAVIICFNIYFGYKLLYLLMSYLRLKKTFLLIQNNLL